MADITDVQQVFVALIAQLLYPNGTGQPSIIGSPVKVYAGWPQAAQLDADLIAGTAHVTVFPTNIERNTTRYPRDNWQELAVNPATVTLSVAGKQITVAGSIPAPFRAQNVMAMVDGAPYVYATQANDTPTSIATALAALIPGASNIGAVITVPGVIDTTRVGTTGTLAREIRRQERVITLTVWADTPDRRKAIGSAIDEALSTTQFVTMADQFGARVIYRSSHEIDQHQKAKLYRRDLNYSVEYATTQTINAVQVTQIQGVVADQPAGATAPISTVTVNI